MNKASCLLFLTCLLALAACNRGAQQQPSDNGVRRTYWDNGNLRSELQYADGKLNGECSWFWADGQRQMQATYTNDTLDGPYLRWHQNGQVFQEGQYDHGMMDGLWLIFYPSGALAGKAEYQKGTGKQTCYEESGYKCLEVPYVDNVKHGREIYYNPDGRMTKIVEYEKGKVVFEDNDPQNIGE